MSDFQSLDRVIVLGLDGVPWSLINRWTADGELPNVTELREEGASGPLRSTTPPTTALAWPSIASGTWPDAHGIYAFRRLTPEFTHRPNTGDELGRPALWELLEPAVVGNVPMTYPAPKIDGRMVTGMMAPEMDKKFTHPTDLSDEIRTDIPDYEIGFRWGDYHDRKDKLLSDIERLVENRRELMRMLVDPDDWRLAFYVYTAPDRLQHLVWDEERLLDHYRHLDDIIGEAMQYASEAGATLFVVSDHGFGKLSRFVHVNHVLEEAGYLRRRDASGTRSFFSALGFSKSGIRSTLERIGVDEAKLVRKLPNALVDSVASRVPGENVLYDIDHAATTAAVYGPGNVYVHDSERFVEGTVDPGKVKQISDELVALFRDLQDPETGERVLDVHDGEELYPRDSESPDLVLQGRGGYSIKRTLSGEAFMDADARAGEHRSDGVFLAWGPDIATGAETEDASVVDIAPTVLHVAGEPVLEGMDGRVLSEVFAAGSPTAERTIRRRSSGEADREPAESIDEDYDDVEDRLRGLGYIE
jgi:predicted AlkP superfamily phosphohydrolase/phosphomutase